MPSQDAGMHFLRACAAPLAAALTFLAATPAPLPPQPSPPPPGSAADTYFGVRVADPYRIFEDPRNPALMTYFRAQNAYTLSVLDALPGRTALALRIAQLDGASESLANLTIGRRLDFYLRRPVGASALRLYVRARGGGAERLVLDPDRFATRPGTHYTIDFYAPSPDDRYVAAGISEGGSEVETTYVVDVASRRRLPDVIDRTPYFAPTWRADGRAFFYFRTPKLAAGAPQSARDTKGRVLLHVIGTPLARDRAVFGYGYAARIPFAPEDAAAIELAPDSRWALAIVAHGVQNEIGFWIAPRASLGRASIPWRRAARYTDGVTAASLHGDTVYALSHRNAERFALVAFDAAAGDAAHAHVAVPQSARVIAGFGIARDAIYINDLDRGISRIRRAAFRTGALAPATSVRLQFGGAIGELDTDDRADGATFVLQGWTHSPRWYAIAGGRVRDTGLRRPSPIDFSAITADEVEAVSADGTRVPLSIVRQRDFERDGTHPALLDGYGAYGVAITPSFAPTRLAWLERGAVFAECHPRGGGELGNAWHFAAHIATKQRTIDDFVACAHYLIAHRYTVPAKLAGMGTSAGGITIGNAIVQQPALFAAAIDNVGDTNGVRDEFAEGGPANIPEFGSNTEPTGFKALYATDAYVQMRPGIAYPAVLAFTGAHDPRVAPWIVAKFIAKLQMSTTSGKPVLLRVDFDAGHGLLGSSREQARAFYTDLYGFLLWQLGDPAFTR